MEYDRYWKPKSLMIRLVDYKKFNEFHFFVLSEEGRSLHGMQCS